MVLIIIVVRSNTRCITSWSTHQSGGVRVPNPHGGILRPRLYSFLQLCVDVDWTDLMYEE